MAENSSPETAKQHESAQKAQTPTTAQKNMVVGIGVVILLAIVAIGGFIFLSNQESDSTFIPYEDSEVYAFEYPDDWEVTETSSFVVTVQPQEQVQDPDDMDFDDVLDASGVTVQLNLGFFRDLTDLLEKGDCQVVAERAANIIDESDLEGISNVEAREIAGKEGCYFEQEINFFTTIETATYVVEHEGDPYQLSYSTAGNVSGSDIDDAERVLESVTFK